MIDFTLSESQQAARDYAHQVALEEMRPISLECDRTEKIPESFFWNMQKRYWAGAAGQARQQDTGEEERQQNVLSVLAQEEMAWGDAALSTAIPGPGLAAPPILSQGTPEQQMRFLGPYMDGQLHWGALALTEPGIGSDAPARRSASRVFGVGKRDDLVAEPSKCRVRRGCRHERSPSKSAAIFIDVIGRSCMPTRVEASPGTTIAEWNCWPLSSATSSRSVFADAE